MSATAALNNPPAAAVDWRTALTDIAPQLTATEKRADAGNTFVEGNYALLKEWGFLAAAVPAELGGMGLSRLETAAFLRALAHHASATGLAFAMHTHPVAFAAWRWKHQNAPTDGLLKRIAAERLQILSSGGSDWLPGSGEAVKVEGGYRINARKIFASGAPSANLFMTMAVEQTPEGPTVLHVAVPMNTPGVSIVETWDTMGMRGSASHDVVLKDVLVADAAVTARRPSGKWHPLMHTIAMVAFPLVYAAYTGVAEAAYEIAIKAARSKGEAAIDAVGELHNEWTATRTVHDAMVAFAETAQPGPETTNTMMTYRTLVARSAIRTVELAIKAAGGASYFTGLGLEKLFRDVQGARFHPLRHGDQRKLAGRVALGLPIDG